MMCHITSPQQFQEFNDLKAIVVPTEKGELEILEQHAELFCLIEAGNLKVIGNDNQAKLIPINSGVAHFSQDKLTIIY